MAKISIIIPVYNGARYLNDTVRSLLLQTVSDFEIIIVNDGSNDNTEEVISLLQKTDRRVTYITKPNTGVSNSRNEGLQKASGEFVVFFDADDIAEVFYLEDRVAFLEGNADYGICGSEITFINEEGVIVNTNKRAFAPGENVLDEILTYNQNIAACPSNLMIRRKILTGNGVVFNQNLSSSADKYFLCQLSEYTQSHSLSRSSLRYRVHSSSMSGKLSVNLLYDKIKYVDLLKNNKQASKSVMLTFLTKSYYMLTAMAFKLRRYRMFIRFGTQYFMCKIKAI